MISMSMISLSLIGVAIALLLCALLAKLLANEPQPNELQRAEIIERLLAIAEEEKGPSGTASSVRLRAPLAAEGSPLGYSAAIHSNK